MTTLQIIVAVGVAIAGLCLLGIAALSAPERIRKWRLGPPDPIPANAVEVPPQWVRVGQAIAAVTYRRTVGEGVARLGPQDGQWPTVTDVGGGQEGGVSTVYIRVSTSAGAGWTYCLVPDVDSVTVVPASVREPSAA
jgi:hypothetical protein